MARQMWKPGNMVYPVPAAMVTVADKEGHTNIITIAWTGTICSDPPMTYVSVKPERYSHHMLEETGEFVINLTTRKTAFAADYCGVKSGRDVDKWKETGLTAGKASKVAVPVIEECPVNIECQVTEVKHLGSHDMFMAKVVAVDVDESYMNENGKFDLNGTGLIAYSHGEYRVLGEAVGKFGYSVQKKRRSV